MPNNIDPLILFGEDRERARQAQDAMAPLCTVANIDLDGRAQMRTLVLREVGNQLAIFINATSPKWQHLLSGFVLHTYWPSVQIQYRMHVQAEPVRADVVHESWHLRPEPPKRMDWFYEHHDVQSSEIESREALLAKLGNLELPRPLHAPDNARGLHIHPIEIERLDLTQSNGIHDRQLFRLIEHEWQKTVLVP